MNPAADKAQAVENSYTMKVNKRKLENAKSDDTKETLEKTIREDTQTIGASVTGSYQNVLAAKASMDLKGSTGSAAGKDHADNGTPVSAWHDREAGLSEQKVCIRFCRDPGTDCKSITCSRQSSPMSGY